MGQRLRAAVVAALVAALGVVVPAAEAAAAVPRVSVEAGSGCFTVYLRDRTRARTTLVSATTDGRQARGCNLPASLSGDGTMVAFASDAPNLAPGHRPQSFVYLKHVRTGRLAAVAAPVEAGLPPDALVVGRPSLSRDGRFVSVTATYPTSSAVLGSFAYVLDRSSGRWARVCGPVCNASVGPTGRHVLILQPSAGVDGWEPSVLDRVTGRTRPLPPPADGLRLGGNARFLRSGEIGINWERGGVDPGSVGVIYRASDGAAVDRVDLPGVWLSGGDSSGRYVALLFGPDGRSRAQAARFDRRTRQTLLVSVAPDGTPGNHHTYQVDISATGRHLAFYGEATNLLPSGDHGGFTAFAATVR